MSEGITPIFLCLYWLTSLLYFEFLLRFSTTSRFITPGLMFTFTFTIVYALMLFFVNTFLVSGAQWTLTLILISVATVFFASQLIYYKIFKMYYTFYSMGNAGQVLEFIQDILAALRFNLKWLILLFVPLAVLLIFRLNLSASVPGALDFRLAVLALSLIIYMVAKRVSYTTRNQIGSSYEIYLNSLDPTVTVARFGLLTTMRLDFQRTVMGMKAPIYNEAKRPAFQKPTLKPIPDETLGKDSTAPQHANVRPIHFEALIEKTTDKTLIEMHTYFQNAASTAQNEYTGRFKGYNLILITAESLSPYSIHPEITPTLYKMVHEGFNFTNFYNPIWGVSTSDGEYVACTGLLPKSGVWSFIESAGKSMAYTLGNQLRLLGYNTNAYHNHTFNYYRRHLSHPNMGYTYKGLGNGLNVQPTWPESDLEMMEVSVPEFIASEPFHTYYMTVSGHMRYTFSGNAMAAKNRALVEHLPYSNDSRAYLATQIELDRAMASLLEQLETAGVAERTLIAMSADHYPYALAETALNELAGHKVETNFEIYQSPFILYAPGMIPETIGKPCSSLDIIPTLSNLLGLDYDSRLLSGRDIFSNSDPLVIFLNKSFITGRGRFDATLGIFMAADGSETVDSAYIREILNEINDKFYYAAKILDKDYYRILNLNDLHNKKTS